MVCDTWGEMTAVIDSRCGDEVHHLVRVSGANCPPIEANDKRRRLSLFDQFPYSLGLWNPLDKITAAAKASHGERAVIE